MRKSIIYHFYFLILINIFEEYYFILLKEILGYEIFRILSAWIPIYARSGPFILLSKLKKASDLINM